MYLKLEQLKRKIIFKNNFNFDKKINLGFWLCQKVYLMSYQFFKSFAKIIIIKIFLFNLRLHPILYQEKFLDISLKI